MSLISEALKKAQRSRSSESSSGTSSGGGAVSRHSRSPATQPIVWIVAGAAVLVSMAVVTTVFLLRPAAPALSQAKAAAAPPAANTANVTTPSPLTPAPVIPPAPKGPEPAPIVTAVVPIVPKPAGSPTPDPRPSAPTSGRLPPSLPLPAPTADAKPDVRIQAYVDAIKVAGIRSSGADSKVLMNDHVYRMNDIVDRSLNLRLVDVQADSLTFVDENNVVYVKNF